jgi:HAD superfamily hydrolase (TIGR01509 family)
VLLLLIPDHLPVKRGDVIPSPLADQLRAVTFDFGNTLVPVDRAGLRDVVRVTGRAVAERLGPFELDAFLTAWAEERERQFREEVPRFREVDLADRFVRVLARLRGMPPPSAGHRWDQAAAAAYSDPEEIDWAVAAYSVAFVEALPAPPFVEPLLARLAARYALAVLSNWPLAATVDRFVEAAGWSPYFRAIIVSQRVGTIKPHPTMFATAREALGSPAPASILHVGDDWAADVIGATRAGWRTAYLVGRPPDSPLPSSERDASVHPDVEIASLEDLGDFLLPAPGRVDAARR